jgi:hypothetical protein
MTRSPGMFRPESTSASLGWCSTRTVFPSTPSWSRMPWSTLVFGTSITNRSTTLTAPPCARWVRAERSAATRAFLGIE